MLIGLMVVGCGLFGTTVGAAQLYAGSDVVLVPDRQVHLAYIIKDTDILVKKTCQCTSRQNCDRDSIQLTG